MSLGKVISRVSNETKLTKEEAEKAVECIINTIINNVSNGDKVQIQGLGTFEKTEKNKRMNRNPLTGKMINVYDDYCVKYRSSDLFNKNFK
jgi:DNA-binding protein HU-beta